MARYAAFLRGVSPVNARMPELVEAFEAAGFTQVVTVLASGNVVFDARATSEGALARRAEEAMRQRLRAAFPAIVRPVAALQALLASDPYGPFRLAPGAKRVVTFLREEPESPPALPIESDGARILLRTGREVLSAYVPSPRGPVFMALLEKAFGREITTRTWDTVAKVAAK